VCVGYSYWQSLDGIPASAQLGTVVEGRFDVGAKLTRKERKQTFVDEILADRQIRCVAAGLSCTWLMCKVRMPHRIFGSRRS
jgi:hypothetical protein